MNNLPSRLLAIFFACALLVGLTPKNAFARLGYFAFQMDPFVGGAELIAQGQLQPDGTLAITQVFRGSAPPGSVIIIADTGTAIARLRHALPNAGAMEVIVSLNQHTRPSEKAAWRLSFGPGALVGLADNSVWTFGGDPEFEDGGYDRSALTPADFLLSLRAAVSVAAERDRLLALPPSAARARQLIAFLRERANPTLASSEREFPYDIEAISQGLRPIHPEEEQVLLVALQNAQEDWQRQTLLTLLSSVSTSSQGFLPVEPFTGRGYTPHVRAAAIGAIMGIDYHRAQTTLAAHLSPNDPLLDLILNDLNISPYLADASQINSAMVMPLVRLAQALQNGTAPSAQARINLMQVMANYGHPRFIPLLYERAMVGDDFSSDTALTGLQSLTGLTYPRSDRGHWDAWWHGASPLLGAHYDLQTPPGRETWLQNYDRADDATRRILLRLWLFEPTIPEGALLAAVEQPATADAAKSALSELWEAKRLSPQTKQAIVQKFITVSLTELEAEGNAHGGRELRITGICNFRFPPDVWVDWREAVAIGGEPLALDKTRSGELSLGESGPLDFGGMGGGIYPGSPSASALLEVEEPDHAGTGKTLWAVRWPLGPIRLRDLKISP